MELLLYSISFCRSKWECYNLAAISGTVILARAIRSLTALLFDPLQNIFSTILIRQIIDRRIT